MKTINSKRSPVGILILISCFMAIHLHAEIFPRSLFSKSSSPLHAMPPLRAQDGVGNEQAGWRRSGAGPELGNGALMILAGVGGNVVGFYSGAILGRSTYGGAIIGGLAGSTLGSALGVYLAGSSFGGGGNFGAALGGSLLGELAAFGLAFAIRSDDVLFMPGFLILPPLGAALAFNSSRRNRAVRAGNGLLSLEDGRLGIGVPDIQVRPLFVPGTDAKPEWQFSARLLSVTL